MNDETKCVSFSFDKSINLREKSRLFLKVRKLKSKSSLRFLEGMNKKRIKEIKWDNGHVQNIKIFFGDIFIIDFLFKILMKRELKKEQLAKLYREFSRQKYNKYRHQFPRMRESELVSKIIKEWEGLTLGEKQQLYNTYTAEKHISDDKSESSERKESPGSSKEKKKKSQSKSVSKDSRKIGSSQTPAKKSSVKVFVQSSSSKKEKDQSVSSDFARDGAKKDFEISESDSKEIGVKAEGKKKRIYKKDTKQPRTEYLKFFKFYYDKLTIEHSRWNANQISTIIKLLWKKKLTTDKAAAKGNLRAPRDRRPISGRMAFRKSYGYEALEGYERWRQLPEESKHYWKVKGLGVKSGEKRAMKQSVEWRSSDLKTSEKPPRKGSESSSTSVIGGKSSLYFMRRPIA